MPFNVLVRLHLFNFDLSVYLLTQCLWFFLVLSLYSFILSCHLDLCFFFLFVSTCIYLYKAGNLSFSIDCVICMFVYIFIYPSIYLLFFYLFIVTTVRPEGRGWVTRLTKASLRCLDTTETRTR